MIRPAQSSFQADGTLLFVASSPLSLKHLQWMNGHRDHPLTPAGYLGPGDLAHGEEGQVPYLGSWDRLETVLTQLPVREAMVSLPGALGGLSQRISGLLQDAGIRVCHIPTPEDQQQGRIGLSAGNIDVSRLLQRPAHRLDEELIRRSIAGRRVLITGAGGSIGSQIARIVCRFGPHQLLLMDRSENGLFEIDRRIAAEFPQVRRSCLLHDVTDAGRTSDLIVLHRPQIVFHAAAHKHVPMMEDHPREAVNNNFFGTRAIADAAAASGVERFVMVSTDKAVNPTSVMGATKRMAELYIQHLARSGRGLFSMVRFGNVLGSACSVVPIWTQQLSEGGPLTVTDPRMTRFFMTIPEAASLVIQAACLEEHGGSIFLLDMGEPLKIMDLADRFIRLHGLEPGRDVRIVCTGIRPGEKLYEELSYASEDLLPTAHPAIRLLRTQEPDPRSITEMVRVFESMRSSDDRAMFLSALHRAVPQMEGAQRRVAG